MTIRHVFDAGDGQGLMRQLDLSAHDAGPRQLVAPLRRLALSRRDPLTRDLAAYRRRPQ